MEQLFVLTVLFAVPSNYPRIKTHYHMYLLIAILSLKT